ncbi:hypothetical protein BDA99DRAFT_534874 [Phascolomyces articulosus]|uniref:Uncharacterized protein n=1 Tax=Phascolomyces articulosus TaxID=60185 RepID=A0AAD5KM79_9FUNG|nr:hypothetical protein BDA99DRAFT_534874 [Phascolomyces articulosus]
MSAPPDDPRWLIILFNVDLSNLIWITERLVPIQTGRRLLFRWLIVDISDCLSSATVKVEGISSLLLNDEPLVSSLLFEYFYITKNVKFPKCMQRSTKHFMIGHSSDIVQLLVDIYFAE